MADLVGVPSDRVMEIWPTVKPWVEAALATGDGDFWPEDILGGLLERRMQLWVMFAGDAPIACCVTAITVFPRSKVLEVMLAGGGTVKAWEQFGTPELERWGKAMGCTRIQAPVRKGLVRRLNWKPVWTVVRRTI